MCMCMYTQCSNSFNYQLFKLENNPHRKCVHIPRMWVIPFFAPPWNFFWYASAVKVLPAVKEVVLILSNSVSLSNSIHTQIGFLKKQQKQHFKKNAGYSRLYYKYMFSQLTEWNIVCNTLNLNTDYWRVYVWIYVCVCVFYKSWIVGRI